MSQHTQGQWKFLEDNGEGCGAIVAGAVWICEFLRAPSISNARLITAAPELLAALEYMLREQEREGFGDEMPDIKAARAAIAKATGEKA